METGRVLSAIDPEYVGALSLMLIPGTPLHDDYKAGRFELLEPNEILEELGVMISATHLSNDLFHANHASNYLPINGTLQRDKAQMLTTINSALQNRDRSKLRDEHMRGL